MAKEKKKKIKPPKYIMSPLNNQMINYQVYYMSFGEKLLYSLLILLIGGAVGIVFYGGMFKEDGQATSMTWISNIVVFVLVGMIAVKVFLPAVTAFLREQRQKKLKEQFKSFLEILSASLAAGNTINDSFVHSRKDLLNQYLETDYIIIELTEIIGGLKNGHTLEEMILAFGKRSGIEDIENFSNVMGNCYRMGGNFKDVVRRTRDIISEKMEIAEEITTKISSNKTQLNVMCLMPILLVAMLKSTSADFATNLASPIGVAVTTIAIGVFVGAYFWGQKIIDIR